MDQKRFTELLGSNIAKIRAEKGMTQKQLADACDFEKSNMSRIESGNTSPTLTSLLKIAQALDVDISELFKF